MPYLIRRPRVRRFACAAAGALALSAAVPAVAAAATANCSVTTAGAMQAFSQFGDPSWYTLAPGGDFSTGGAGWSLGGATVDNSQGGPAPHALTIPPGQSVTSAPFCVSSQTPTFRFYARQHGPAWWYGMLVNVIWTSPWGQQEDVTTGWAGAGNQWTPTGIFNLAALLPTWNGASYMVQIQFVNEGGPVQIADLYVDPYTRG